MTWWPVTLVLLVAPFGVWGWAWVDKQRLASGHERVLKAERAEAENLRRAAYDLGRRTGAAEVRDLEDGERRKTAEAMEALERELAEMRDGSSKAPPEPTTPADVIAECKRSASCRERRALK